MSAQDLISFRDTVAADVGKQYPSVDYLSAVVARVIERHIELLGWQWMADGPQRIDKNGEGII